jgi:hypothetical protein
MTGSAPTFVYRAVGEDGFDAVQPLWEKLKAYHSPLFRHFAVEHHRHTFEPRKQAILAKATPGKLRIELVSTAFVAAAIALMDRPSVARV